MFLQACMLRKGCCRCRLVMRVRLSASGPFIYGPLSHFFLRVYVTRKLILGFFWNTVIFQELRAVAHSLSLVRPQHFSYSILRAWKLPLRRPCPMLQLRVQVRLKLVLKQIPISRVSPAPVLLLLSSIAADLAQQARLPITLGSPITLVHTGHSRSCLRWYRLEASFAHWPQYPPGSFFGYPHAPVPPGYPQQPPAPLGYPQQPGAPPGYLKQPPGPSGYLHYPPPPGYGYYPLPPQPVANATNAVCILRQLVYLLMIHAEKPLT